MKKKGTRGKYPELIQYMYIVTNPCIWGGGKGDKALRPSISQFFDLNECLLTEADVFY